MDHGATPRTAAFALTIAAALACSGNAPSRASDAATDARSEVDAPVTPDAPATDARDELDAPVAPDAPATDASDEPDAPPPIDAGGCPPATTSTTLPGLAVSFPPQRCVFTLAEAAAGVTFEYDVVVSSAVTVTQEFNCEPPLVVEEVVAGGGERYCVCDVGLCMGGTATFTLEPGTSHDTLDWTGRNWDGPSDTGMPLGAPFPAGDYAFEVHIRGASGASGVEVDGALPIRLVP